MNKALLSIGTNEEPETNLAFCHHLLNNAFQHIVYSDTSVTAPYGEHYTNNFLNQLAVIHTEQNREDISILLKSFEKQMGRTPADKQTGVVKIDIDIVIWNDEVVKPNDISRSYIANLLPSLK